MKKKKNKRATNLAQARKEEEERLKEQLKDIDRFAGSSEDDSDDDPESEEEIENSSDEEQEFGNASVEGDNDDRDENYDDEKSKENVTEQNESMRNNPESSDEDEYGNVDNDSYDDDSESDSETNRRPSHSKIPKKSSNEKKAIGMSNAMAKILGMGIPSDNLSKKNKSQHQSKSAILSKTTTKLQKQQEMERKALQSLRQKRKLRRAEHLTAMHIPVGNMIGTTPVRSSAGQGKISQWEEINMERSYRRIATRGVVALFNAISKHQLAQREQHEQNTHGIKNKQDRDVQAMTKRGFLDALKQTANKTEGSAVGEKEKTVNGSSNGTSITDNPGKAIEATLKETDSKRGGNWNALRDDFMMGAKLKVNSDENFEMLRFIKYSLCLGIDILQFTTIQMCHLSTHCTGLGQRNFR